MGLTRQYLKYIQSGVFGVVGSNKSNLIYLEINGEKGRYCAMGACEDVVIWDLRTAEQLRVLRGDKHEVSVICASPDSKHLAVGYNNGTMTIFDVSSGELTVTFNGHKSSVSALKFDPTGLRLVSGGKDTDVIVWDVVAECGLFRLKGHKGLVTQLHFMKSSNILLTSSKDTFIKFWDLDTQHCFKTLVGHRSEIYDFVLLHDDHLLITGSADSELRAWTILHKHKQDDSEPGLVKKPRIEFEEEDETEDDTSVLECVKLGSVMRHSRNRLMSMATDRAGKVLVCHGNGNLLEVFKIMSEDELKKYLAKRQKKAKRKQRELESVSAMEVELTIEDRIAHFNTLKMSGKLRSVDVYTNTDGLSQVASLLTNNSVETCSVEMIHKNSELSPCVKLSQRGHRSDVRTVSFSSDSTAILSASGESVKIWNRTSLLPIRTMKCGYALCSLFTPGDRHVVIGTKTGNLELYDLASGSMLEEIPAHTGPVWSIAMAPDKRSILSGSADHEVKFWYFELVKDNLQTASKRLSLEHTKTLKMDEDVLCVKYSPDQRLIAVALLDNTVKVFFADTLKFFLSLYGHKLPVLCLDISTDSTLIVTGSADRNIKIWGLDFGDCHKSIFAHDDSIMCVQFVPKTHFLFTGGKDNKVKEWDADNFEHIQTLEGHHSEVWCLAVSPSGNFLVSGSHDKSLRLWEKTQEPLILEEEREMEREREYEETVGQGEEPVVAGETTTEVKLAGKKTLETVKAAERIMEALQVYREEMARQGAYQEECQTTGKQLVAPGINPLFTAYSVSQADQYVREVIKRVRSSELEEALLVLPFDCVIELLKLLEVFLDNSWEVELTTRCLLFLLKVHQGQITSTRALLPVMDKLRVATPAKSEELIDRIGFNLAGLQFLKRHFEESEQIQLFSDATDRMRDKRRKEKKKAILAVHT